MRMAMKLKYYLRGAGIGIVATTLVFSIANAVSSANKRLVTGTEQTSTESSILAYTQKDTQAETIKQEEETTKEQTTAVQEETTTQEETTIGQPQKHQNRKHKASRRPGQHFICREMRCRLKSEADIRRHRWQICFCQQGLSVTEMVLSVIWQRPATQPK
jgi:uncharacterized membrane protein YhiD involved in acid resistance